MPDSVAVIVAARDVQETLPALLAALRAQTHAPDEVIVIDDGSTDATAALAEASPVVDRVLRLDGAGPGAARNAGVAAAGAQILAFTDGDCTPTAGWLEAALGAMDGADVVQGAVTPPPGVDVGPFDRTIWVTHPHGLFETANLLVRRAAFEQVGGFKPWLRPRRGKELGEDVWLGYRLRRGGARIAFAPDAVVHHAVFPRGARDYVAERARLRFFPVMTQRIPELRETFLWRRFFMSRRSAAVDAAAAGAVLALVTRRRWPLLAALPWAGLVRADLRRGRRYAAAQVAADAVGMAALAAGSVASRTPVL